MKLKIMNGYITITSLGATKYKIFTFEKVVVKVLKRFIQLYFG